MPENIFRKKRVPALLLDNIRHKGMQILDQVPVILDINKRWILDDAIGLPMPHLLDLPHVVAGLQEVIDHFIEFIQSLGKPVDKHHVSVGGIRRIGPVVNLMTGDPLKIPASLSLQQIRKDNILHIHLVIRFPDKINPVHFLTPLLLQICLAGSFSTDHRSRSFCRLFGTPRGPRTA